MAELTLEQFNKEMTALNKRLDDMVTKDSIKEMVTKTDFQSGLDNLQKNLEDYTDQVANTILDSIDTNFQQVRRRLDMRDHKLNKVDSEVKELKSALSLS